MNPVAWAPPLTPLTCQVTAVFVVPVTVAVNCCVVKIGTEVGLGVMVTVTDCATVTMAEPEAAGFATETAVTVTVAGLGMVLGAVYSPVALMVPTVALPPATPFTCQVTAVFVVPETVAVNWSVAPGLTVEEAAVTVTVICG